MSKFRPGQSVKINPYVYDDKWEGYKELYRKFGHHNIAVDRVIDMTDVGKGELVVVDYLGQKEVVKPSYLWDTTFGNKKEADDNKTFKMKVPECCGECSSMQQIYYDRYICYMKRVIDKDQEQDISTAEVDPNSRPERCPIVETNNKIANLDPEKRQAVEMMVRGLSVLFGTDGCLEEKEE